VPRLRKAKKTREKWRCFRESDDRREVTEERGSWSGCRGQSSHLGSPFRGGGEGAEGEVVARGGDSDLDSYFEGRARVGKSRDGPPSSTSGPDKYEGSTQSDQDGPGESDNGDEENRSSSIQSRTHSYA
jgi:hypothetical protein